MKATDFPALDLLPADFSYRHLDLDLESTKKPARRIARLLESAAGEYDHVFLDCAPSISLVSESVFEAADVLLAPTIPTTLSLRTLAQLMKHLKGRDGPRPRVLPFFCMVDRRKALHREVCDWVDTQPLGFLKTRIPYSSLVEQMGVRRAPLGAYAPRLDARPGLRRALARDPRPAARRGALPRQAPAPRAPRAVPRTRGRGAERARGRSDAR